MIYLTLKKTDLGILEYGNVDISLRSKGID